MRAIELVELRKNPHQNSKDSIENYLLDIEFNTKDEIVPNVKNTFTSFTSIEKLGINPKSIYNTPLGIYAYPTQYVTTHQSVRDVEYAGEEPFLNTFKVRGNILKVSNMTQEEFDEYKNNIIFIYHKLSKKNESACEMIINELIDEGRDGANDKSIGGIFWYVTWVLSNNYLNHYSKTRPPIIWNWLFRQIGIDGVVDMGNGIIHENEPTQAVFFSKEIIYDVKRFNNTKTMNAITNGNILNIDDLFDAINFNRPNIAPLLPQIKEFLIPAIKKDPNVIFNIRPFKLTNYFIKLYLQNGGDLKKIYEYKLRAKTPERIQYNIDDNTYNINKITKELKKMNSLDPQYQLLKKQLKDLNTERNHLIQLLNK